MAKNKKQPSVQKRREAIKKKQEDQSRKMLMIGGVVAIVIVGLIVWQLLPQPEVEPSVAGSAIGEGTVVKGERPLAALDPIARADYYSVFPENILKDGVDYQAIIRTSKGDITLDLYEDAAPLTVNNFVFLANQGFYDGTVFHRVLADFMAQAGDPTGTGLGGPGYEFGDETNNGQVFDRRGQLAMANGGPGTNGSQFFITFIATDWLTGSHTIFGEMLDGNDVLSALTIRNPQAPTSAGDVIERIDIVEN